MNKFSYYWLSVAAVAVALVMWIGHCPQFKWVGFVYLLALMLNELGPKLGYRKK